MQAVTLEASTIGEYFPAAQGTQEVEAFTLEEQYPAKQLLQVAEPATENFPLPHSTHVLALVAPIMFELVPKIK